MTAAILLAAVLVPIAMKLIVVPIPTSYLLLGYANPAIDGFSKIKGEQLYALASAAFLAALAQRPRLDRWDAGLAIIALLMLVSAFTSAYSPLAWSGVPYIFEDIRADICYCALFFAARRLPIRAVRRGLPLMLGLALLIVAILGLSEAAGLIWINESPWRGWLLARPDGSSSDYLGAFRAASLPFGNPNYVGLFCALLWPYFAGLFLVNERWLPRLASAALALLGFATLLVSLSRAGLLGGSLAILMILLGGAFFGARRDWFRKGLVLALLHGLVWGFFFRGDTLTSARLATIPLELTPTHFLDAPVLAGFSDPASAAGGPASAASNASPASPPHPPSFTTTRVSLDQGRLHMEGDSPIGPWGLLVERAPRSVKFMDLTFKPLIFAVAGDRVVFQDARYQGFPLSLHSLGALTILTINGQDIAVTPRGFRLGYAGAFIKPRVAERFPLPIADEAFSSRGRIWAYSLPILAHTLVTGYGPGAFPFEFPNNDPVLMANFGPNAIVDKPHNSYIGFAVAHGLPALCLLLLLGAAALRRAMKSLKIAGEAAWASPLLMAIIGYGITALTVDSTLGVATPFWILLGTLAHRPFNSE